MDGKKSMLTIIFHDSRLREKSLVMVIGKMSTGVRFLYNG